MRSRGRNLSGGLGVLLHLFSFPSLLLPACLPGRTELTDRVVAQIVPWNYPLLMMAW